MAWKIGDKITVDPADTDLVPLEKGGITRNTTWLKLKQLFLGTTTLSTTDKTVTGAINEVNTSLSDVVQQIVTTPTANKILKLNNNSKLPASITGDADSVDGIQGNQIPLMTTANITYYVATTGLDTNDGLTSGTAFKTIQNAINKLPQIINHAVTINALSGTYNEAVNIKGYSGYGSIAIKGGTDLATAINYLVTNITIYNCSCLVSITGITATSTTLTTFLSYGNISCIFAYCNVTASSPNGAGFYAQFSMCYVNNCNASNRKYGIVSDYMSTIFSNTNTGSSNTIGLYALDASTIGKSGSQPSGTTAESSASGGVIR